MSTDTRPAAAGSGDARPPGARGAQAFRRRLYGSIGVFTLLVLGLVALNLSQGPRMTGAQLNVQTSVERAGQRLLLQANEVIAPVGGEQVTVNPAASITTTTNQTSIQVEFTDVLAYNTTYTVTATGVRSAAQDASSTFTYSFTTPDAEVYVRVPGTAGVSGSTDDRIERHSLIGDSSETVFSAPHIRQFTTLGPKLVVTTTDADGYDLLDIVSFDGTAPIPVQLAGPGTVTGLVSSAKSNLFGYTYRAAPSPYYPTSDEQLYIYDTTLGQAYSIPVTGPDHELLDVAGWAFVPGTTSLIAERLDGTLFLVDVLGLLDGSSAAVEVGRADALLGFLPGTKVLVTESAGNTFSTDFTQPGAPTTVPFPLASPPMAADGLAPAAPPEPLDPSGAVVALGGAGSTLDKVDSTGTSTLFTAPAGETIIRFCLSTNGRYTVAETATTTTFVPLASTLTPRVFDGTQPDWCSAS